MVLCSRFAECLQQQVSRAIYCRQTNRTLTRIRAGLTAMIYRHITTLQTSAVKDSAAVTLMGTDVERIIVSLRLFHEMWASILEVGIGVWLLARQLGAASVVPVIICLGWFGLRDQFTFAFACLKGC